MVDPSVLATLAAEADAAAGSLVVEVGPGTGLLTAVLLERGHRVLAVEVDAGLHRLLTADCADAITSGTLQLVHGDALAGKQALHPAIVAAALEPWCLVANLPYDVSIPVLLNSLALPRQPLRLAATVQYEAAVRLCAAPGEPAWGASAAVAAAAGRGEVVRRVPARAFEPPPRVASAVLRWRPERPLPEGYPAWVRGLFAFRRKTIVRALRDTGLERERAAGLVHSLAIDTTVRVEALDVDDLLRLHRSAVTS